jgi:hypothetical protein
MVLFIHITMVFMLYTYARMSLHSHGFCYMTCNRWYKMCARGFDMTFGHMPFHMTTTWSAGVVTTVFVTVKHFCHSPRSYATMCPVLRRLGAGGALTVLRFAPLARLCPVPGFYAHFGACCQVHAHKGAFWRTSFRKLEGGKWRRPNFFIFWPIEVP